MRDGRMLRLPHQRHAHGPLLQSLVAIASLMLRLAADGIRRDGSSLGFHAVLCGRRVVCDAAL